MHWSNFVLLITKQVDEETALAVPFLWDWSLKQLSPKV